MIIFLIILISILFLTIYKSKENMGSMHPNHYYVLIDLEYLDKNYDLGQKILKFMKKNYKIAKLFFGNLKVNVILVKYNKANLYNLNKLNSIYPDALKYHYPKNFSHLKKIVEGKTILYLADENIEKSGLKNRFLNMQKQINFYQN